MMKALFVDDDVVYGSLFAENMRRYCKELKMNIQCDVCNDSESALGCVNDYDIYFLDIELGKTSGLILAEEIRTRFPEKEIIFVSLYETYVFQAFKVKPLSFIRKDELETDLYETLFLVKQRIYEKYAQIAIHINNKNVLNITPKNLVFCQSDGHYVQFVFNSTQTELCRIKLNQVEEILKEHGFIRVHVSYLVNEVYIERMYANELKLFTGESIPISRTYKAEVYNRIFK